MPVLAGLLVFCMFDGTVHGRCGELANAKPDDVNVSGRACPTPEHLGKETELCSPGALGLQYKSVPSPWSQHEDLLAFGSSSAPAIDAAIVPSFR